jgi:hypothetical protein
LDINFKFQTSNFKEEGTAKEEKWEREAGTGCPHDGLGLQVPATGCFFLHPPLATVSGSPRLRVENV